MIHRTSHTMSLYAPPAVWPSNCYRRDFTRTRSDMHSVTQQRFTASLFHSHRHQAPHASRKAALYILCYILSSPTTAIREIYWIQIDFNTWKEYIASSQNHARCLLEFQRVFQHLCGKVQALCAPHTVLYKYSPIYRRDALARTRTLLLYLFPATRCSAPLTSPLLCMVWELVLFMPLKSCCVSYRSLCKEFLGQTLEPSCHWPHAS